MSPFPRKGRTALVVQAVLAVAFGGWLLLAQNPRLPWNDHVDVKIELADGGGLRTGSRALVTVAGVPSGKVGEVRYENGRVIADVRLDEGAIGKVHRGARATVQPRSALNDLVLDLTAGDPRQPALKDGDVLPARDTSSPVALDEVLTTLDTDARAGLQVVLDQLDTGTRTTDLGKALAELDPVSRSASSVAAKLAARRTTLTRLTRSLDRLGTALAAQAPAVRRAITSGRRTTEVVAGRAEDVKDSVRRLPSLLRETQAALSSVDRLGTDLDPALRALRPAVRELPDTLKELDETVPAGRELVAELRRTSTEGAAATRSLRRTLERLGPLSSSLQPSVERAEPTIKAIDRYKNGIGLLGERFSGIFSTADANGVILRGLGFFEAFDPANFGFPGATGAKRAQVAADALEALTRVCKSDNQLACLIGGLVPGLQAAAKR